MVWNWKLENSPRAANRSLWTMYPRKNAFLVSQNSDTPTCGNISFCKISFAYLIRFSFVTPERTRFVRQSRQLMAKCNHSQKKLSFQKSKNPFNVVFFTVLSYVLHMYFFEKNTSFKWSLKIPGLAPLVPMKLRAMFCSWMTKASSNEGLTWYNKNRDKD